MKRIYLINTLLILILLLIYFFEYSSTIKNKPIRIGLLFSTSGYLADNELPVMRATLLAIEEINQKGGVDGRRLLPIIYDTSSDLKKYSTLASKMIITDHVSVIFGCWTSASRKVVKPIVEKHHNLLIYPRKTEGLETSENIIYLGALPNQQFVPAAYWMFEHYGRRVYLLGSDVMSAQVENEILSHNTQLHGGDIIATQYILRDKSNLDAVINDIIKKKPDFIFNLMNAPTNSSFYHRLHELTSAKGLSRPPVMSFDVSENELQTIGMNKMSGDLTAWTYLLQDNTPENRQFLDAYVRKYGRIDKINDTVATAYSGVYLWAEAANQAPSITPSTVRDFILAQSISSPVGPLYIDPHSGSAWRSIAIAKINEKATYDIVWHSSAPIEPVVYPFFKTKSEWAMFERKLYRG
jgi:urea transport system substrate-binding protein